MSDVFGAWSENADRLVPRGTIAWLKGPLGFAGNIDGKHVASIRVGRSGECLGRIEGWQWDVTPDMATSRFNQVPGDKITTTVVKAFKSPAAAKAELEAILSPDFVARSAPTPATSRPRG